MVPRRCRWSAVLPLVFSLCDLAATGAALSPAPTEEGLPVVGRAPMLGAFTMHGGVGQTYVGSHHKTPQLQGSILVVSEVDVACVFSAGSSRTSGYRYVPTRYGATNFY